MLSCKFRAKVTRNAIRTGASAVALMLVAAICVDSAAWAQAAAPETAPAPKKAAAKAKPKTKAAKSEASAKKDPAVAQQQIDAGIAALNAGKAEQAVQQFTAALSGGNLPPSLMAKAQYQRGIAYRKLNKPALAISDLTQALWLKNGLNETERADALQNRVAAYRDAGLPDQEDSGAVAAGATKPAVQTARAETGMSASTGSIPAPRPAPAAASLAPSQEAPSNSGGLGGVFSSIFGVSSSSAPQPPATPPAAQETARSSWSSVEVKPAGGAAASAPATAAKKVAAVPAAKDEQLPWLQNGASAPAAAAAAPARTAAIAPAAAPATGKGAGPYRLQVSQVKSAEEAQALAAKLKQQMVVEFAGREASVVAVQAGGFGTLHRVSFGPFIDPAEWKSICPKLLSAGYDCLAVRQ